MTLATAGFALKTKVTRRAQFLAEIDLTPKISTVKA